MRICNFPLFFQMFGAWASPLKGPWEHEKSFGFLSFFYGLGPGPHHTKGPGNIRILPVSYVFSMVWGLGLATQRALGT